MKVYEIIAATNGILLSGDKDLDIVEFTQDSRKINQGAMYIPIIGERFDGHDFIDGAFNNGAAAVITNRDLSYHNKVVIKVEDTLKALQDMASYLRRNRNVKVIGVTGSVGKTSTKDMIYSVVSKKYATLKTLGNYNNNIGLPLTILRLQDEEVLILEMGMNHLKEISELSYIATPDIAAITNVGTAHIGELGSRENILKAKLEIVDGMSKGSTLIINNDNDLLHDVTLEKVDVVKVGIDCKSSFQAENVLLNENDSEFDIVFNDIRKHVYVPVQGKHFVLNALVALAIGVNLGIDIDLCIEGIKDFELTKNRMDIINLKDNIILIDGSYNASEDSMKSSLDVLQNYKRRRIAVLADMLELGEYSKKLHNSVGEYVGKTNIDILICVGNEAKYIAESASKQIKDVYCFENNEEVIKFIEDVLTGGDVVLFKGSNGMNLKEIVEYMKGKMV